MRVAQGVVLGVLALLGASCWQATFACESDDQCRLDGADGVCALGGCALPDDSCPSRLRYHDSAPGGLGGTCVPVGGSTGGTGPDSGSSSSDSGSGSVAPSSDPTPSTSSATPSTGASSTGPTCDGTNCGCAAQLETGHAFGCAVRTDGQLRCWGVNESGQVGVGNTASPVLDPTAVALPGGAAAVSIAAWTLACALDDGGDVHCWGPNGTNVAAPGVATNPIEAPTTIALPFAAAKLRLGRESACAISENGEVACWGNAEHGELGTGVGGGPGPVEPMFALPELDDIAIGRNHTCALQGGNVSCWGRNVDSELGVGPMPDSSDTPLDVSLPDPVVMIAAGGQHTCVVLEGAERVACWGNNHVAQTGAPPPGDAVTPNQVDTSDLDGPVAALLLYDERSCVLTDAGSIYCWGLASDAVYGTNEYEFGDPQQTPRRITPPDELDGTVLEVDVGGNHMCVRTDDLRIFCWGDNRENVYGGNDPEPERETVELDVCL